jgi:LPS-assembly lipoprotein
MKLTRAAVLLAAAFLLAACGFHPLYAVPGGAHGEMRARFRSVYVEPVSERLGYQLRNQLIDLIDGASRPNGATYRLRLTLNEKNDAIAVQSQQVGQVTQTTITRYNDKMTVGYELVDARSGAVLANGVETGLSSYNVLPSPYATLVAQQDAEKRAADDIADRIRIALAVYFAQKPK